MAGHGGFNPQQIFRALNQFVGTEIFGILYDAWVVGPENQRRFKQFVQSQNASVDFVNEINKKLGVNQIAIPGSAFARSQSNLAFHQDQLSKLDPNDPSQAGAIAAEEAAIAKAEGELAPDPNSTLAQLEAIGQETGDLARDFLSDEAVTGRFDEDFDPIIARLLADNALFQRRTSEAQAGHDAILSRAQGLVSELGEQEEKDILERIDATESQRAVFDESRGLGGTTVTTSREALFDRERTGELGRLNERLIREQLSVEQTFGLAGLGFQERSTQFGANLNLATTGALAGISEFRFNAQDQGQKDLINFLIKTGQLSTDFQFDVSALALNNTFNPIPPTALQSTSVPTFQ